MKLALVYNPADSKLLPSSYSGSYRDMFEAVRERFAPVQEVTENCEAATIEADAILFWDVHSSHQIEIPGIEKHPAVKLEYFNDPHQKEQYGEYRSTGQRFHKLSAFQRCERAQRRGVRYIICPYKNGWEKYLAPHAGEMELRWFPVAPKCRIDNPLPIALREGKIVGTGHLWEGEEGFRPYEFRAWAYKQPQIWHVDHALAGGTPGGVRFQKYLEGFAGALALCDEYVVPKYLEIPLAGCVCFCQRQAEYAEMGFHDEENCMVVDRNNWEKRVNEFLTEPGKYQEIAEAGRRTALNWTAERFAEWMQRILTADERG